MKNQKISDQLKSSLLLFLILSFVGIHCTSSSQTIPTRNTDSKKIQLVVQKGFAAGMPLFMSKDHRFIVNNSSFETAVFDRISGAKLQSLKTEGMTGFDFQFLADNQFGLLTSNNIVSESHCYNLVTGELVQTINVGKIKAHQQKDLLVYSDNITRQTEKMNLATKKNSENITEGKTLMDLYIEFGGDEIYVMNTKTWQVDTLKTGLERILDFHFHDDENKIFLIGLPVNETEVSLELLDIDQKKIIAKQQLCQLFSPYMMMTKNSNQLLVFQTDGTGTQSCLQVYNSQNLTLIKTIPTNFLNDVQLPSSLIRTISITADGKFVGIMKSLKIDATKIDYTKVLYQFSFAIIDVEKHKIIFEEEAMNNFQFHPKLPIVLLQKDHFYGFNYMTGDSIFHIPVDTRIGSQAQFSDDGQFVLWGDLSSLNVWDIENRQRLERKNGGIVPIQAAFHPTNNCLYLATSKGAIRKWCLDGTARVESLPYQNGVVGLNSNITFSNSGNKMAFHDIGAKKLRVLNVKDNSSIFVPIGEDAFILGMDFSPDEQYLLLQYRFKTVDPKTKNQYYYKVFELNTNQFLKDIPHRSIGNTRANFVNDAKQLALLTSSSHKPVADVIELYDMTNETKKLFSINSDNENSYILHHATNNKSLVAFCQMDLGKTLIQLLNIEKGKIETLKTYDVMGYLISNFTFSKDAKHLYFVQVKTVLGKYEYQLLSINVNTGEEKIILDETNFGNSIFNYNNYSISADENFFCYTSYEGIVKVFSLKTQEQITNLIISENNGYVFISPDNYYMGSKSAMNKLRFSVDETSYSFRQFDMQFNRPDLVYQQLPNAKEKLTSSFYHAYQKRLKKMGIQSIENQNPFHVPTIAINHSDYSYSTDEKFISLTVNVKDEQVNLDRINIYVNDVPLFGIKGYSIRDQSTKQLQKQFSIELSQGINQIRLSCMNVNAAESMPVYLEINNTNTKKKSKLYLIAIGVSEYNNSALNLDYAEKDAKDILQLFQQNDRYSETKVFSLYNNQFTKEELLNVKEELMQSRVDDQVIIFVASHGIVNQTLDYYLGTSNIDFQHPEKKGVPYEALEDLLNGIPARQKLLLVDACHSGEIDKETVQLIKTKNTRQAKIKFRSFENEKIPQQIGLENSFELMKELFVDLRQNTGAVVISSASGLELAMEGEQWNNGVFTYCLLRGLSQKLADENQDGKILISELQNYLQKEVTKISDNNQRPTTRVSNLSYDWQVW